MNIEIKDFVTEVRGAGTLSEALAEDIGEPCMLMVFGNEDFKADRSFPADTPYITAFAAEGEATENVCRTFDLVIPAGDAEAYTEKLYKDKTLSQIREINACFTAARTGSQEDILACESRAFYRLMAQKNGGGSNE